MVGFVGSQARRRKRNRLLISIFIILLLIFFIYLPSIDFSNNEESLPNEILPSDIVDEDSLASEVEELKLEVFQKDQRIKFRDNQIIDLREEKNNLNKSLNELKVDYENVVSNIDELQSNSSDVLPQNLEQIKILNDQIDNLNTILFESEKKILSLEDKLNKSTNADEDLQQLKIENSILKNEIKQIKEKNSKSLETIDRFKLLIEEKDTLIENLNYLKDLQHHG
tara:strand:- start:1462 stop:2136 length:675 start_codon:yes stop_codon:yes gene_type:complete